jgi:hypothetical protein
MHVRQLPQQFQKSRPFVWTEEVEEAFEGLKRYLTSSPAMVAPDPSESLLLYARRISSPEDPYASTRSSSRQLLEVPAAQPPPKLGPCS